MNDTVVCEPLFQPTKPGYNYLKPGDAFYYLCDNLVAVDIVEHVRYDWGLAAQSIEFTGARYTFTAEDLDVTVFSTYEAAVRSLQSDSTDSTSTVSSSLRPGELEQIQSYVRKELSPEDVFVFSAELLDNDVDNDNEKFTVKALKTLSRMFVGKTGYIRKSDGKGGYTETDTCARIFSCAVEPVEGSKTSHKEDLFKLKSRIYIFRSEETNAIIEAIESGKIDKVYAGCAVSRTRCSICGGDPAYCDHIKGKYYPHLKRTCYNILEEPVEAYDFYIRLD